MNDPIHTGTQAVWGGEEKSWMQGATQVPVVHSVSFGYRDMDEWLQVANGEKPGHIYGRNTNPTVQAFEEKCGFWRGRKPLPVRPRAWASSAVPCLRY